MSKQGGRDITPLTTKTLFGTGIDYFFTIGGQISISLKLFEMKIKNSTIELLKHGDQAFLLYVLLDPRIGWTNGPV